MRRSEVGQSKSWPEGQPEGRCGAWGRASQALTGRPWVSVRPVTGSATVSWLDGDRRAARIKRRAQGPLRGSAKSPEERTRVLRRCGGTLRGVAVCLCFSAIRETSRGRYQGAPFGVPSPLNVEGRKLKAQLARRRGNESAWLFESEDQNFTQDDATFSASFPRRRGPSIPEASVLEPRSRSVLGRPV
jgi:hypothetical protein